MVRLMMAATRFEANSKQLFDPESEILQRPEMLLFWSEDQGRTWSRTAGSSRRFAAREIYLQRH